MFISKRRYQAGKVFQDLSRSDVHQETDRILFNRVKFIIAKRATGGFHQARIHGHAFVDGKPLGLELAQDLGIDLFQGSLAQPAAKA